MYCSSARPNQVGKGSVMLAILGEKIHDNRFLRLMHTMLKAGYLEDWIWNATLSGAPQGGVVSPVMSNIYLHKLDVFIETILIPEYTRGLTRKQDPGYARVLAARGRARKRGDQATARELLKRLRVMPSMDLRDPGYRRLRYIRYADDILLGFTGPKAEAEQIKARLAAFLRDELRLELSEDKTLITHARTRAAKFLGYEISVGHSNTKVIAGRRRVNGSVRLRVPTAVIKAKSAPYMSRGKPACRAQLVNEDDHTIVAAYGAQYRGIVQYYLPACNVSQLSRLHWVMQTSLLKTLANKHRSSVSKMAGKYMTTIGTPNGPRRCVEARIERSGREPLVARFGGISLKRQKTAVLTDRLQIPDTVGGKELIARLLANRCEICRATHGITVHHVRRLSDLDREGRPRPAWAEQMTRRRRKTLIVCRDCHDTIHAGKPAPSLTEQSPESGVR